MQAIFLLALGACSSEPTDAVAGPRPKLTVTPPRAEVIPLPPPAPSGPVLVPRQGLTVEQRASAWDQHPGICQGCDPMRMRAQASTERIVGELVMSAESAQDGDPSTGWCGMEGVGDQLALASGQPFDLKRITIAGWTGSGPAITELLVSTDRKDRFLLRLPGPNGTKWPDGGSAPTLDVELTGVQHVQFEVRATSGRGMACIAEVGIEGVRTL